VSNADSGILDDVRIGVRLKIAALWIAMLFLFAYGDIFGFFNTGRIEEVIAGEVSGMKITQGFLFGASVYIAIASVMIFLTLVLTPKVSRWTNIVLAVLYHHHCGLSHRRNLGVLLLPEHCGERALTADHLVRVDVAPACRRGTGQRRARQQR
jgi:hypothetical protein